MITIIAEQDFTGLKTKERYFYFPKKPLFVFHDKLQHMSIILQVYPLPGDKELERRWRELQSWERYRSETVGRMMKEIQTKNSSFTWRLQHNDVIPLDSSKTLVKMNQIFLDFILETLFIGLLLNLCVQIKSTVAVMEIHGHAGVSGAGWGWWLWCRE